MRHHDTNSETIPLLVRITQSDLRTLTEDGWPAEISNRVSNRRLAEEGKLKYFRFVLQTPRLPLSTRKALAKLGVDPIEEGGAYEAYGIVEESRFIPRLVLALDNVLAADPCDPPTGM